MHYLWCIGTIRRKQTVCRREEMGFHFWLKRREWRQMSDKYFKTSRVLHSPLFFPLFFFQVKSTKSTNWKTKLTQKLHRFSMSQSLQRCCGPKSSKASHPRMTYEWRQQWRNLSSLLVSSHQSCPHRGLLYNGMLEGAESKNNNTFYI